MSSVSIRKLCCLPAAAALLAVCSWVSVPAAVPFTLQTFGLLLVLGLLGGRGGALAVSLVLGGLGLPVFAGMRGGVGVLLGPTGGYIVGFLLAAPVMGCLQKGPRLLLAMAAAQGVVYAFGTVWFVAVYTPGGGSMSIGAALASCVLPYLLPDTAKLLAAAAVVRRAKPVLARLGLNPFEQERGKA